MNYSSQHIQSFFKVSHQTVWNWCEKFDRFLSPTARPPKGKQRVFVDDDLGVFALAHEMLGQGRTYKDVIAALDNGSRGQMPAENVELLPGHVSGQVLALRETLMARDAEIKRLQTALDESNGQNKLLERQIKDAQTELKEAYKQIGKLGG